MMRASDDGERVVVTGQGEKTSWRSEDAIPNLGHSIDDGPICDFLGNATAPLFFFIGCQP